MSKNKKSIYLLSCLLDKDFMDFWFTEKDQKKIKQTIKNSNGTTK